jgi:hypothetical protein
VASAAASSICSSAMLIRQVGIQGTPNPGAEAMQRDTTNRSLNERKERERERELDVWRTYGAGPRRRE